MKNRKAQIAPFMVLVIAVVILAISATILISEMSFIRLRLANVTDGAAISAASKLCQQLNQIRAIDVAMKNNSIFMQAALAKTFFKPFPSWAAGYAWAYGGSAMGIYQNQRLFSGANDIAKAGGRALRNTIYGGILQGALIDEPKPFLASEVTMEGNLVTEIDYKHYNDRDDRFTELFIAHKKDHGEWYQDNLMAYAWNKYYTGTPGSPGSKDYPGVLTSERNVPGGGYSPPANYDSYLAVTLKGVDREVTVKKMPIVYIFFYIKPVPAPPGFIILPGFVVNPWGWIRGCSADGDAFEINVYRKAPFKKLPFFSAGEPRVLWHQSRIKMLGSIRRLFRFNLRPPAGG